MVVRVRRKLCIVTVILIGIVAAAAPAAAAVSHTLGTLAGEGDCRLVGVHIDREHLVPEDWPQDPVYLAPLGPAAFIANDWLWWAQRDAMDGVNRQGEAVVTWLDPEWREVQGPPKELGGVDRRHIPPEEGMPIDARGVNMILWNGQLLTMTIVNNQGGPLVDELDDRTGAGLGPWQEIEEPPREVGRVDREQPIPQDWPTYPVDASFRTPFATLTNEYLWAMEQEAFRLVNDKGQDATDLVSAPITWEEVDAPKEVGASFGCGGERPVQAAWAVRVPAL